MTYSRCADTDDICREKAKRGSGRLLAKLKEHHDANIPAPPPRLIRKPIVVPLKDQVLCEKCSEVVSNGAPRVHDVKRAATRYFQLHATDLDSHRRTKKITYSRQVAMYLSRTLSEKSFPEIARRMGGRDHTTAIHACRKIENLLKSDWRVAYDVAFLEGVIIGDSSHEQVR